MLLLGIVAVLVAAWGAAAPFAGPDFGYVADRAGAWQWSVTSACLGLGPGALAMLASLVIVAAVTRPSYARRADLWLLGLVVTLCGAWFVVGQYVWPVIYGKHYIAPSNVSHFMWKELAFAIGPGVILVFCGAVFMGWAVRRQLALVADRLPRTSVPPAAGTPGPGSTIRPRAMGPTTGNTGTMAGNTGTMAPPPATETSATEAPATGTSATGAPATETSATGAPATEAPATEAPVTESSATRAEPPLAEPVTNGRPSGEAVDSPAASAEDTGGATDVTVKPSSSTPPPA